MRIGAIIQSRMSSSRLPGKALIELNKHPVIYHINRRLLECKNINTIVLATSADHSDDPLQEVANKLGINLFRGSLNDVLDRYYQAAIEYELDIIVRITGDCPLVDPDIVDEIINHFLNGSYDLFSVGPKFPDGLDCQVFSMNALSEAWKNAKLGSEREHVCPYIENNPKKFNLGSKNFFPEFSHLRLTLDEELDLSLIKYIYDELNVNDCIFSTDQVIRLYKQNKKPFQVNASIKRNEGYKISLEEDRLN